jgi:hypothetical protein
MSLLWLRLRVTGRPCAVPKLLPTFKDQDSQGIQFQVTNRRAKLSTEKQKGVDPEPTPAPKCAPIRGSELEKYRWGNIKSFAQFLDVGFVQATFLMQDFGYDAFRVKDRNQIFLAQIFTPKH